MDEVKTIVNEVPQVLPQAEKELIELVDKSEPTPAPRFQRLEKRRTYKKRFKEAIKAVAPDIAPPDVPRVPRINKPRKRRNGDGGWSIKFGHDRYMWLDEGRDLEECLTAYNKGVPPTPLELQEAQFLLKQAKDKALKAAYDRKQLEKRVAREEALLKGEGELKESLTTILDKSKEMLGEDSDLRLRTFDKTVKPRVARLLKTVMSLANGIYVERTDKKTGEQVVYLQAPDKECLLYLLDQYYGRSTPRKEKVNESDKRFELRFTDAS